MSDSADPRSDGRIRLHAVVAEPTSKQPEVGGATLVDQLEADLARKGSLTARITDLADLEVGPDEWRKAARGAARRLGRPVRTGTVEGTVWAALRDWPSTPEEQLVHDAQLRLVVLAAAGLSRLNLVKDEVDRKTS